MKERYVFIVRHGERADFAKLLGLVKNTENIPNLADPPLTPKGIEQARATGQFIKTMLGEIEEESGKKFDEIVIESSPFARCVSTAS